VLFKRLTLIIFVVLGLGATAPAQLGPDLLLLGGLKLADSLIAKKSETTRSAGLIDLDVYIDSYPGQDPEKDPHCRDVPWLVKNKHLRYLGTYDSSISANIWFGDQMVLRVKPYKNGPTPNYLRLHIDDNMTGPSQKVDKNGPQGGYPYLWIADLGKGDPNPYGAHQIKVEFSHTEWTEMRLIRLNLEAYYATRNDSNTLLQVAGAGDVMYPPMPAFVVPLPDGTLKAFGSPEEAQMGVQQLNDSQVPIPDSQDRPAVQTQRSAEFARPAVDRTACPVQVQAISYNLGDSRDMTDQEIVSQLTSKAVLLEDPFSQPLKITDEKGMVLILRGDQPFQVKLKSPDGGEIFRRDAVLINGRYQLRINLTFSRGTDCVLSLNDRWEIHFSRGQIQLL